MNDWWKQYKSTLELQREGDYRIHVGTNTEPVIREFPEDIAPSEEHTALMQQVDGEWKTVMADSNIEIADGLPFVAKAYGRVLITGLGLGIVPHMLVEKPNIDRIVIVEKSPEVVEMVSGSLPDGNISLVIADAYTYYPKEPFDCAWHDIWTTFNSAMADEIEQLFKRYDKFVHGFQMGWLYEATKILRAYDNGIGEDIVEKCKDEVKDFISFEEVRNKYKDKSKWDTATQSKLGV